MSNLDTSETCKSCGRQNVIRSPWLTFRECCDYLSISRSTLYRLIEIGSIQIGKVGNQLRFKAKDIDALVLYQKPYNKLTKTKKREVDEIAEH